MFSWWPVRRRTPSTYWTRPPSARKDGLAARADRDAVRFTPWGAVIERNGEVGYASLQGTGEMARITLNPPALDRLGAALEDVRGLAVDDLRSTPHATAATRSSGSGSPGKTRAPACINSTSSPVRIRDTSTARRSVLSADHRAQPRRPPRRDTWPHREQRAWGVPGRSVDDPRDTLRAFVDLLDTDPDSETFGRAIDRLVFDDRGLASAANVQPSRGPAVRGDAGDGDGGDPGRLHPCSASAPFRVSVRVLTASGRRPRRMSCG